MQLGGFHHLTAITADASGNFAFYTQALGLRLVKKTVNQDDVSAYHLFYGDGEASPGSDITFFDWPVPRERRGTRSVTRTGLRVDNEESLRWWQERFDRLGITHGGIADRDGRAVIDFADPEGQRLALVADASVAPSFPWKKSPVPSEHQIRGLGAITMSVPDLAGTDAVLTRVMNMRRAREFVTGHDGQKVTTHVYEMHQATRPHARVTAAAELHVAVEPHLSPGRSGAGGVHHIAFRTPTYADYDAWVRRLEELEIPSSGAVNRFYFRSLYFREPSGVLFEIATDEPGFATDEPIETLGERLALPPFLEGRRKEIEAGLKPL